MNRSYLTTVTGTVAGLAAAAHQIGISVGHLGSGDFVTLIGAVSTILLGYFAQDSKKSQPATTAPQGADPATPTDSADSK